jgi:hypothetical protein
VDFSAFDTTVARRIQEVLSEILEAKEKFHLDFSVLEKYDPSFLFSFFEQKDKLDEMIRLLDHQGSLECFWSLRDVPKPEIKTATDDNDASIIIFEELKDVFKAYKGQLEIQGLKDLLEVLVHKELLVHKGLQEQPVVRVLRVLQDLREQLDLKVQLELRVLREV